MPPEPFGQLHCDVASPRLSGGQSEAVSRLILEHSPDCIKLLDARAQVAWVSAAGCRLLEVADPARLIGSPWLDLWPESARPVITAAIDAARNHGIGRFTQPCPTFAGTPKWWHVLVIAVRSAGDEPMLLSLSRDVTELVAMVEQERALTARAEAARDAADLATAQKEELLGVVSHELRVPLNTVLSWAVLLRTHSTDPSTQEIAARIERATTEQILLIDQLLEEQRLDHGRSSATREAVNVREVAVEARAVVEAEVLRRGLQLTFDETGGEVLVAGDPRRLRQVLINLLSNAAKFTPEGGRIAMRVESDMAGCRITVRDSGIGIGSDFLPQIFDRYSQEDRPGGARGKGLGLGLHISKRLVEMHGGTIAVESAGPGRGASFTVLLPALATAPRVNMASSDDSFPHADRRQDPPAGSSARVSR